MISESGDIGEAMKLYKRSLGIKEVRYGKTSSSLCEVMYQMAQLLAQSDRVQEGLGYISRVASIARTEFGEDHPLTVDAVEKEEMLKQFV
eukprot:m.229906 g.229906  ORF g.229906 m.229906 type:complete len:90 (-) comp13888_c1_seq4:219-488(-)